MKIHKKIKLALTGVCSLGALGLLFINLAPGDLFQKLTTLSPSAVTDYVQNTVMTGRANGAITYDVRFADLTGEYGATTYNSSTRTATVTISKNIDKITTGMVMLHEFYHVLTKTQDGAALGGRIGLENGETAGDYGSRFSLHEAPAWAAQIGLLQQAVKEYLKKGNKDGALALIAEFNRYTGPQYLKLKNKSLPALTNIIAAMEDLRINGQIDSAGTTLSTPRFTLNFFAKTNTSPGMVALFRGSGTDSMWVQEVQNNINPIKTPQLTGSMLKDRLQRAKQAMEQLPNENDIAAAGARAAAALSAVQGSPMTSPGILTSSPAGKQTIVQGGASYSASVSAGTPGVPEAQIPPPPETQQVRNAAVRVFNLDAAGKVVNEVIFDQNGQSVGTVPASELPDHSNTITPSGHGLDELTVRD